MEYSSKINVYFRKKPYFSINNEDKDIINLTDTSINIENCKPRLHDRAYFSSYKNLNILGDTLKNTDIYDKTIKNDICHDKATLLIAYGQTGSGKTHTLTGSNNERGIIPLGIQDILNSGKALSLSILEIYNNVIYDLLPNKRNKLEIFEVNNRIKYKTEPENVIITDSNQLDNIIVNINKKRAVGNTKLNDRSSRAHTIYFFSCLDTPFKFISIDLAGNERGSLTNAVGFKQNQEYIEINKSLFALKECIRSIYLSKPYIPYRRSRLTILLREILYNDINIHFIGTINSSKICYPDIIDTIEYGICLKKSNIKKLIRNDIPRKNIQNNNIYTNNSKENIRVSIKELSQSSSNLLIKDKPETSISRCRSAPSVTQNNSNVLEHYYNYILSHYNSARRHQKIYSYLKKTGSNIDKATAFEIQKIINKSTYQGMRFIDKHL